MDEATMDEEIEETTSTLTPVITPLRNPVEMKYKIDGAGETLMCFIFFSCWCEPCRDISRHLLDIIKKYPDVIFSIIDVDNCEELQAIFNITMVPTMILIKMRRILEVFVGKSISRLFRRIQFHVQGRDTNNGLRRLGEFHKDERYIIPIRNVTYRFPNVIERMGLIVTRTETAWKDNTGESLEAFQSAEQRSGASDFFGEDVGDALYSPKFSGELTGFFERHRGKEASAKFIERPTLRLSQADTRLLVEERYYSPEELDDLVDKCQAICHSEPKKESKFGPKRSVLASLPKQQRKQRRQREIMQESEQLRRSTGSAKSSGPQESSSDDDSTPAPLHSGGLSEKIKGFFKSRALRRDPTPKSSAFLQPSTSSNVRRLSRQSSNVLEPPRPRNVQEPPRKSTIMGPSREAQTLHRMKHQPAHVPQRSDIQYPTRATLIKNWMGQSDMFQLQDKRNS